MKSLYILSGATRIATSCQRSWVRPVHWLAPTHGALTGPRAVGTVRVHHRVGGNPGLTRWINRIRTLARKHRDVGTRDARGLPQRN
jgi:hypothetical protein